MTPRYPDPPTNLRSLRDRLVQAARREGVVFGRLQQHVAVLVVAQFASSLTDEAGVPLLLVKGGSALELRRGIAHSRTSKDFDAVARRDIHAVHQRFTDAAETGWEGFTGALTPPEVIDIPGLPVPPRRFVVKLKYRHQPFASVPVEVSTIEAGNANSFDHVSSDALRLLGLPDTGPVPCMTLPWQIAQKLHACTAAMPDGRTNDRAHDLVDLQILEALLDHSSLAAVREACIAVFDARAQQSWPPQIVAPPHWTRIYTRALDGLEHLDLAANVADGAHRVQQLVDRIAAARG